MKRALVFPCSHLVQFYEAESAIIDPIAEFFRPHLEDGGTAVMVGFRARIEGVRERLIGRGLNVEALIEQGRYIELDAHETLNEILSGGGEPCAERFFKAVGSLLERASGGKGSPRIYGEMVAILAAQGKFVEAALLEQYWNELAELYDFSLMCGYPMGVFDCHSNADDFAEICGMHSHVIPAESFDAGAGQSDRYRFVSSLQQKAAALAGEIRRKDEFLAMLSHELRNPLAAMSNSLSLLLHPQANSEMREDAIGILGRQMALLGRISDDLIEVSRITRGRIDLRKELVDIRGLTDRAVAALRPDVERSGHDLCVSCDHGSSQELWVEADPARLEQVLSNLLTNAIKYTPEGGAIRVELGVADGMVEIRVKDDGIGISAEALSRVFELFSQGERSLARSRGGLGIGLTVVKRLVEMHRGSVCASSPGEGLGSEFLVRLPAASADRASFRKRSDAPQAVSHKRILVVDDNRDSADSLAEVLRLNGHDARVAYDSATALTLAAECRPEVALLDIGLPVMDGFELAKQLRALPCLAACRIVAVSGYGAKTDRSRSVAAGFDDHLVKPVDIDTIIAAIRHPSS